MQSVFKADGNLATWTICLVVSNDNSFGKIYVINDDLMILTMLTSMVKIRIMTMTVYHDNKRL